MRSECISKNGCPQINRHSPPFLDGGQNWPWGNESLEKASFYWSRKVAFLISFACSFQSFVFRLVNLNLHSPYRAAVLIEITGSEQPLGVFLSAMLRLVQ